MAHISRRPHVPAHTDRAAIRAQGAPPQDLAAFTSWAVSNAPYRYHGRFTLHAAAETVADRVPPTVGMVEAIDEQTCELRAGSNSLDALAMHVALLGVDFVVHEPEELAARVALLAERLRRARP